MDDLLISTPMPQTRYFVVFGHNVSYPWPASFDLSSSTLTGQNGFTIQTTDSSNGALAMIAVDLNNDSYPEVSVSGMRDCYCTIDAEKLFVFARSPIAMSNGDMICRFSSHVMLPGICNVPWLS